MDKNKDLLPCGHPRACVQIGEEVADGHYVHYCGWCASLEQLQHQRRLWKFAAKLHREQHLAFQEICHAQAERIIDLHSERQRLREALEAIGQARAWAAVWKRAAKGHRSRRLRTLDANAGLSSKALDYLARIHELQERLRTTAAEKEKMRGVCAFYASEITKCKDQDAEIRQLREARDDAKMAERARCLNVIASYAVRTKVKPHGAVGQALAFVLQEMKGSDHE